VRFFVNNAFRRTIYIKNLLQHKLNNLIFRKLPLLVSALTMLFLVGCISPKKKKEDVGFVGRKYQDLTAYYNGYYNANVLIEQAIVEKIARHPDNYQEILPIFPVLLDKDTASAGLTKAIDKLKRVVFMHPASEWNSDSYLQIGRAQFLKNDFETAENSFKYVTQEFNPEKIEKQKLKKMSASKKKKGAGKETNSTKRSTGYRKNSNRFK